MWTSRHPPHSHPPFLSQLPSPRAGQLAPSLGHLCAALGLPATIVISTKGPPRTNHLPIIHSNQPASPHTHPPPSSPPPFIYSGSYTQAGAECVCVCVAHTPFCYPHREAQLGKCAAFIKRTPFSLIKIHRCPFFYSRPQNEMDGWNYCAFFPE